MQYLLFVEKTCNTCWVYPRQKRMRRPIGLSLLPQRVNSFVGMHTKEMTNDILYASLRWWPRYLEKAEGVHESCPD